LSDEELMDKVQRASIRYFTDKAHSSGMPFERTDPEAYGGAPLIPMGGTGFAIQNILVGAHRGWVSPEAALAQIERMVDFLEQVPKYHGAFSHFYHAETKQTFELFPKDNGGDILETALLMTGLLCAREYFSGNDESSTRLRSRIDALWHAVEWDWYTNNEDVLYWHWSEEHDFGNKHEITGYNEGLGLYTLAAASPTHPISPSVYHNGWSKSQDCFKGGEREHYGIKLPLGPAHLKGGPLFFELFNFMGLDPKGLSDAHANYAEQARAHVLIDRAYCEDNPRRFQDYSHKLFGLTECDTPDGYRACSPGNDDGTIAPYASIASMQFTPEESMVALRKLYEDFGDKIKDEYGFFESLNPTRRWYSKDRVAVHHGTIAPGIERARSTFIQDLYMCDEIKNGLIRLGFKSPHLKNDSEPAIIMRSPLGQHPI
jgi:hypothetical protein